MVSVEIENRNVGRIIGPRGATIKQLQSEYNVSISISKEPDGVSALISQFKLRLQKKNAFLLQNGRRYAQIDGNDDNVRMAVQAIEQRFGNFSGNRSYQQNNYNRGNDAPPQQRGYAQGFQSKSYANTSQNVDDEWDTAAPQYTPQPINRGRDDWDPPQHKPSANTYQRSNDSSTFNNSYNRPDNSYNSRPQNSFAQSQGGGFKQNFSSDNRATRSYETPPQTPVEVKEEDFEPIDWDKANAEAEAARKARWEKCPIMVKDFYLEHSEVTNMTDEEVDKFRVENKNIVVARTFAEEGSTEKMPKPATKFEHAFEKFPDLMQEIIKAGFEKPSPIQSQMWPILLSGEDCIGIAQTGTGKTLAFLLPALIHIDGQPHPRGFEARGGPNVLVLAPTRELAIQIEKEVGKYQFRGIRA